MARLLYAWHRVPGRHGTVALVVAGWVPRGCRWYRAGRVGWVYQGGWVYHGGAVLYLA